jgi:beta-N-acetylhexosaminidase
MMQRMARGRVLADLAGTRLAPEERDLLCHPQVGGVILFARNFESAGQLAELTAEIHALRSPRLLVAVDHEGGRVQRFREGFTLIPAMRTLGTLWNTDEEAALRTARSCGMVLAAELRVCGVDLSFAPVLDLDHGPSGVIGDRAFHRLPDVVAALAAALTRGMRDGGMAACGKHFPGHGFVAADSHLDTPVDTRPLAEIECDDILPFRRLVAAGLEAVMPAHVIYPAIDNVPAGFSRVWLEYLRANLGFDGLVFSDDLSMEGAKAHGGVVERGAAALDAGCDMLLLCNSPDDLLRLVDGLARRSTSTISGQRIDALFREAPAPSMESLSGVAAYQAARADVKHLARVA